MAKKDFTKKRASYKKSPPISWVGLSLVILLLFISTSGVLIYKYKHQTLASQTLTAYFSQTESWFKERTLRLHKKLEPEKSSTTKKTAANKEELESVHFEFYTALPNMQMGVKEAMLTSPDEKTKAIVTKAVQSEKRAPLKNIVVVSQDELEQDFSDKLKLKSYIVQMGIFQTQSAANRYQKTIIAQGFAVNVVKAKVANKEFYRVQIGPFLQKEKAKLVQLKLQKKGIGAIILLSRENS